MKITISNVQVHFPKCLLSVSWFVLFIEQTADDFIKRLKRDIKEKDIASVTGYVEAPLAYDAVWALALALNKTANRYAMFVDLLT